MDCYFAPVVERSIAIRLSVCVCLFASIPLEPLDQFLQTFVQIPCGCGSVLLWRRFNTLCTSGCMDDVTSAVVGRMAMRCDTGAESDVYECLVWFCHKARV